jgi:signal transduction histidine kinase
VKLQSKFTILVVTIITIPILMAMIVAYFQFIYLQKNQMLFNKTYIMEWVNKKMYPFQSGKVPGRKEDQLPQGLDILLFTEKFSILASSFPNFTQESVLNEEIISEMMSADLRDYQYFLEAVPGEKEDLRMLLRIKKEKDERPMRLFSLGTFVYLFLLLLGLAAIISSLMLSSTNKTIRNLEEATKKIAAGNLDFSLNVEGEDELASLTRSFDQMRKSLKEELARRSRFLMAVSHDLKTPLTSIEGYIEAITDGFAEDPEMLKRYVNIIADKSKVLESRILELIDFVKMETGEWQLKQENIGLKELLLELAQVYRDDALVLNRNFSYSIELSETLQIAGDRNLISRALENLFGNAVRYTREHDRIFLRAFEDDREVTIQVEDNGPGIDEKELNLIFDPFYRGTKSRREQGFGLGLSIVRSIVQAHNWHIEVHSKPARGTLFSIHVPLE